MSEINIDYIQAPAINININGNVYDITDTVNSLDYQFTAGENCGGHKVIYIKDNKVFLASSDNLECVNKIIGMSLNASEIDMPIMTRSNGIITNQGWGLMPNANYYLSIDGAITNDNNTGLFMQKIGFAIDSNNLKLDIQFPILRG